MKKRLILPAFAATLALCSSALAYGVDLPAAMTVVQADSFKGDTSLEKVVLHEDIEHIESGAFANTGLSGIYCKDITSIDIADGAFDDKTFFLFEMDSSELIVGRGQYGQIAFKQYPSKPIKSVSYASAKPSAVGVDSNGRVTAYENGSVEIAITDESGNSTSLTVTVKKWAELNDYAVIAHRGASGYKADNSLAAFRKAAELDAEMIELDVRKTKDGQIVCFHDPDINDKSVSSLTLSQMKRISSSICSLEEALECIAGLGDIQLQIEFKDGGIEEQVLDLVYKHNMQSRTCYGSFYYSVLKNIKTLDPSARTVLITNNASVINTARNNPSHYNVEAYSISKAYLSEALICKLHLAGKQVYGWTIDKKSEIEKYLDMGLDGIITNYPDRA